MGPAEALASLEAALSQHLSAIQRAAVSSAPGGGPEWDGILRHYGVPALDPTERAMIVQYMHLSRGAVPAEFRLVLNGLQAWAQRELDGLRNNPQAAMSPAFQGLSQRVTALVDAEVFGYERALGIPPPPPMPAAAPPPPPPIPGLASIFANAQATSKEVPWAGHKWKSVGTLNCVHCGGPQEQPQDFMCRYCRRPIAGSIKPTA